MIFLPVIIASTVANVAGAKCAAYDKSPPKVKTKEEIAKEKRDAFWADFILWGALVFEFVLIFALVTLPLYFLLKVWAIKHGVHL